MKDITLFYKLTIYKLLAVVTKLAKQLLVLDHLQQATCKIPEVQKCFQNVQLFSVNSMELIFSKTALIFDQQYIQYVTKKC